MLSRFYNKINLNLPFNPVAGVGSKNSFNKENNTNVLVEIRVRFCTSMRAAMK